MKSLIVTKFFEIVDKYVEKTAVVDYPDGHTRRDTSYDELRMLACEVAAHIQSQGIAPQSFITIELPAGAEFLAAEMGIWMAGCVAVPMGLFFPEERKNFIRQHCEAALNIDGVFMNGIANSEKGKSLGGCIRIPDETENALLLYTSGSTGTPKGILHDHQSVSEAYARTFYSAEYTKYATAAPSYFVVAIGYWRLLNGTEVHILPNEISSNVTRLADYHRDNNIDIAFISATLYPLYHCNAASLQLIVTGSDRVVCPRRTSYQLMNIYGLSETMGPILSAIITEPTDNAPIGRPMEGVEATILDDDMRPVPQGETGEICLKGHFCKGYYKDEERTRELYRGGWLHTGDLGYLLPDGRIQFVNRKDWMVKVNGQRVEPGEVEAAMRTIPGIERAVVKGFANSNGSHYLVGYYKVKVDCHLAEEVIRKTLLKKLPPYMVPSIFVMMEEFPLNANGKIDRKSLQAPVREMLTAEYVAPMNDTEAALCDIMAKVLKLPRVGIDDNFRSLGGDSIQMMEMQQLCIESDEESLHNISTNIIYLGATPRKMAVMLMEAQPCQKPVMDDYPLNDMQKGYLMLCTKSNDKPVSNLSRLYRLPNQIDVVRLKAAIEKCVSCHPAFHTHLFINSTKEPRQKTVVEDFSIAIEKMSNSEFEDMRKALIKPYNVFAERLFRIRLFEVEELSPHIVQHYLFIDISHIIVDGVSLQIFYRDIDRAYNDLPIEKEDWTLAQLAAEENSLKESEVFNSAKDWFHNTFDKEKLLSLQGVTTNEDYEHRIIPLDIPYSEVEQFCNNEGVTMNTITTAAFMLTIGHYANASDVTIMTAFSGRNDARTRNTIGYLATQIMVRAQWTAETPTKEFLNNVGQALLDSMGHSIFKISDVMKEWQTYPAYQFIFQEDLAGDVVVGGHKLEQLPFEGTSKPMLFSVQLYHNKASDCFNMLFYLGRQQDDEAYMRSWMQCYADCLRGLMTVTRLEKIML